LLTTAVACGADIGSARARGVLLISVDSLRADHVSSYGYQSPTAPGVATTPVIDRLIANAGTRFTRAYSTTSWTLPAHMAMLTGLPNELHGVRGLPDQLHPSRPLLAQLFRDAGWRTGGFWSGPNLHPYFGFDRGFEVYEDCSTHPVQDVAVFSPLDETTFEATVSMHEDSHQGVTGPAVVEAFSRWFEEVGDDEPFFAFVHLWDVHYDYLAPPEHDLFHPDRYFGPIDGRNFTSIELADPATKPKGRADLLRLISLYDAEIHFTDLQVGRMLDLLRRDGRFDDTLVVFTSDHGEQFLEHQSLGHKHSLFDETVRIPLLMRLPGVVPEGQVVDELVGLVDLAPTILELCGLPTPESVWGTSLVPTLTGSALPPRTLPLELSFKPAPQVWRATYDGRYKVNDIPGDKKLFRDHWFVFDLDDDPLELEEEQVPRAASDARVLGAQELWRRLDAAAAALPVVDPDRMPTELERALESTGYLGGSGDESGAGGDADR
jgi:arylsulfatase A-like enzyme